MPVIEISMQIAAPVERVFDLARSIDLHVDSTASTNEQAISGVTSGLIGLGEEVTWKARHFGIVQTLSVRITKFERPFQFTDSMLRGAFARFDHEHRFVANAGGTLMEDRFDYEAPLGWLGRVADVLFLERYMRAFLVRRNEVIKAAAESEAWRRYLPEPNLVYKY